MWVVLSPPFILQRGFFFKKKSIPHPRSACSRIARGGTRGGPSLPVSTSQSRFSLRRCLVHTRVPVSRRIAWKEAGGGSSSSFLQRSRLAAVQMALACQELEQEGGLGWCRRSCATAAAKVGNRRVLEREPGEFQFGTRIQIWNAAEAAGRTPAVHPAGGRTGGEAWLGFLSLSPLFTRKEAVSSLWWKRKFSSLRDATDTPMVPS